MSLCCPLPLTWIQVLVLSPRQSSLMIHKTWRGHWGWNGQRESFSPWIKGWFAERGNLGLGSESWVVVWPLLRCPLCHSLSQAHSPCQRSPVSQWCGNENCRKWRCAATLLVPSLIDTAVRGGQREGNLRQCVRVVIDSITTPTGRQ